MIRRSFFSSLFAGIGALVSRKPVGNSQVSQDRGWYSMAVRATLEVFDGEGKILQTTNIRKGEPEWKIHKKYLLLDIPQPTDWYRCIITVYDNVGNVVREEGIQKSSSGGYFKLYARNPLEPVKPPEEVLVNCRGNRMK